MNSISHMVEEINRIDVKFKNKISLNQRETASIIGVSSSTLENWRSLGLGPQYIKINNGKKGRVLYPKNCIAEFLSHTVLTA